jgi:predicted amidohydrolase
VIDVGGLYVTHGLNIASLGMISELTKQNEKDFETERLARMAELHLDVIVGVKVAHYIKPHWCMYYWSS